MHIYTYVLNNTLQTINSYLFTWLSAKKLLQNESLCSALTNQFSWVHYGENFALLGVHYDLRPTQYGPTSNKRYIYIYISLHIYTNTGTGACHLSK